MPIYKRNLFDCNETVTEIDYPDVTEIRGLGIVCPKEDDVDGTVNSASPSTIGVIHNLVREGEVEELKAFIRKSEKHSGNVPINEIDERGLTPLHYGARYASTEMVQVLIEFGANINQAGLDNVTPLTYAARHRQPDQTSELGGRQTRMKTVIQYLLDNGASVNCKDAFGQTALHYACWRLSHTEVYQLVQHVSLTEVLDHQKMSPLHVAAIHGSLSTVKILVRSGCRIATADEKGQTPFHKACMEGRVEVVSYFLTSMETFGRPLLDQLNCTQDTDGNTGFHLAVQHGFLETVEKILSFTKAALAVTNNKGSPLDTACETGNVCIVHALLSAGASGTNALHTAAVYSHAAVIKELCLFGAATEVRNKENYTPLLAAIVQCKGESVQELIKLKANCRVIDNKGNTAVCLAAKVNFPGIEKLLQNQVLRSLMDVGNNDGNTPLHIASRNGHIESVRVFLELGAQWNLQNYFGEKPLHQATKSADLQIVQLLLSYDSSKKSLEDYDENGATPLHIAATKENEDLFRYLLNTGSNVKALDIDLMTPLHRAASVGMETTVKIVLAKYPKLLESRSRKKRTPLHLAARNGHVHVVECLLYHGADVTCKDGRGHNALLTAIYFNQPHVAAAIIRSVQWKQALSCSSLDLNGQITSPLRLLIERFPGVAQMVFDRCISTTNLPLENANFEVYFNFYFLDDTYSDFMKHESHSNSVSWEPYSKDVTVLTRKHPLQMITEERFHQLLSHPLCSALVIDKWRTYGLIISLLEFFLYTCFLIFFTLFITETRSPFLSQDLEPSSSPYLSVRPLLSQWMMILGTFAFMLKECFVVIKLKTAYLSVEKVMQTACILGALIVVLDFNGNTDTSGQIQLWQWEVGAVSIYIGWLNLILLLGRMPFFGMYIVMLVDTLKTFFQFLASFLLFLVAFGLGFYVLLQQQEQFKSPSTSIMKTLIMMTDLDYTSVFSSAVYYRQLTYGLFIIFMVVMSIITMNLLIGLAVNDIKGIRENSAIHRICAHGRLALQIEMYLPSFLRPYCIKRCYTYKLNKSHFLFFLEDKKFRNQIKKYLANRHRQDTAKPSSQTLGYFLTQMKLAVNDLREELRV